ncbi:MAG: FecR family protein [Candidatus Neomarinimicrobiota bacterium]|nr:FecR family protein [Candidatus Neomarinimicrobiota bacterium]
MKRKLLVLFFVCSNLLLAETIGRVMKANGTVLVKPMGSPSYSVQVKPGQAISNGDAIRVGEASFAVVIFLDDKSVVKIRENTDFQFVETSNTRSLIIDQGTTLHNVNKENRKKTYRVETPVSVASVKGTEFSSFHDAVSGVDKFVGKSGNFEVFNSISGATVNVGPGQKAVSNALGQLIPAPAEPGDFPEDPDGESSPEQNEPEQQQNNNEQQPQQRQQQRPQQRQQQQRPQQRQQQQRPQQREQQPQRSEVSENQPLEKTQSAPKKPFNMGLAVGSATINDTIYNQVALRPELSFGKLGIGLDLVMYIDNEGNVRKDEWDEPSDFIDKLLYIRWGQKSDPFWLVWGSLDNVTLGYGGLLSGYSNMMEFPSVRKVGINTGFGFGNFGTEIFLSNMKDFSRGGTLMGLRGTYKISEALPITIGMNFVQDMNQFSGLKDKDGDNYPDMFDDFPDDETLWNDTDGDGIPDINGGNKTPDGGWDIDADGNNILDSQQTDLKLKSEPFKSNNNEAVAQGFAFDIGYPVVRSKAFNLEIYSELNTLSFSQSKGDTTYFKRDKMNGSGITVPGMRASVFGFLNLSFEYRIKKGYFVPQFFDGSYDLSRVTVQTTDSGILVRTKDQVIFSDPQSNKDTKGMYGSASANLFNFLTFNASYANMKADTTEFNSFNAILNLNAENIPKLSVAQAYYQRNNDKNPFDFSNPSINTVFGYKVGYEVSKGVSVIWDFRQYYRDSGIPGDKLEPVKQTTIETAFDF